MSTNTQKSSTGGGLHLSVRADETDAQAKGRASLLSTVNAAAVIHAYQSNIMGQDADMQAMVESLRVSIGKVKAGDLGQLESMLISQATALQTMFAHLAKRAAHQEYLKHAETYMTLALKAQAQSRSTISALVDLKYPRQATFIKQANVANGPQQVNNGTHPKDTAKQHTQSDQAATLPLDHLPPSRARKVRNLQPELLEVKHGSTDMDSGAKTATARGNSTLETLVTIDRA